MWPQPSSVSGIWGLTPHCLNLKFWGRGRPVFHHPPGDPDSLLRTAVVGADLSGQFRFLRDGSLSCRSVSRALLWREEGVGFCQACPALYPFLAPASGIAVRLVGCPSPEPPPALAPCCRRGLSRLTLSAALSLL